MSETFNHTEQDDSTLANRLMDLAWQESNVVYSEERRRQLGHEAACIVFELSKRETSSEMVSGTSAA